MGVCGCNTECVAYRVCGTVNECTAYGEACSSNNTGSLPSFPSAGSIEPTLINALMSVINLEGGSDDVGSRRYLTNQPEQYTNNARSADNIIEGTDSGGTYGKYWTGMYNYLASAFPQLWDTTAATYTKNNGVLDEGSETPPILAYPPPINTFTYEPASGDAYGQGDVITLTSIQNLWYAVNSLITDCVCYSNTCVCYSVCTCNQECSCNSDY